MQDVITLNGCFSCFQEETCRPASVSASGMHRGADEVITLSVEAGEAFVGVHAQKLPDPGAGASQPDPRGRPVLPDGLGDAGRGLAEFFPGHALFVQTRFSAEWFSSPARQRDAEEFSHSRVLRANAPPPSFPTPSVGARTLSCARRASRMIAINIYIYIYISFVYLN